MEGAGSKDVGGAAATVATVAVAAGVGGVALAGIAVIVIAGAFTFKRLSKEWLEGERIGRGAYGDVHVITRRSTGVKYAMKKVPFLFDGTTKNQEETEEMKILKHEAEILGKLNHENIVKFEQIITFNDYLCMIIEYMPNGSLKHILETTKEPFTEHATIGYSYHILKGLDFLHSMEEPIVHGDLKCANILLTENNSVKLCDFGTARLLERLNYSLKSMIGTFHFMSPEAAAASDFHYGTKSDIWSFGCTVVEMLTTRPPWWEDTQEIPSKMIRLMMNEKEPTYTFTRNVSRAIQRALKEYCFQYDPFNRKDAKYLLEHFCKDYIDEN